MPEEAAAVAISVLQIIWIDILLSGDNAIIIALACRNLPQHQRRWGLFLGAGAAVVLRILFASIVTLLLDVPYLRAIGAVLLFWIAVKLVLPEAEEAEGSGREINTLWKAVLTIVVADAAMSLDNVIAVAAVADGSIALLAFGIAFSIPLLIIGSTLVLRVFERFPVVVWAGAGLLGWISGHLLATDIALLSLVRQIPGDGETILSAAGLFFVVVTAVVILRARHEPLSLRGREQPAGHDETQ